VSGFGWCGALVVLGISCWRMLWLAAAKGLWRACLGVCLLVIGDGVLDGFGVGGCGSCRVFMDAWYGLARVGGFDSGL